MEELDVVKPRPGRGGSEYVVELQVAFQVTVVTVGTTGEHSLQVPTVGVIGHAQLPVGQSASGIILSALEFTRPLVTRDSITNPIVDKPSCWKSAHDQN